MAGVKLILWTLFSEDANPQCLGSLDCTENDSYAALRVLLEEAEILDGDFDFWDPSLKCRIRKKLERLNKIGSDAFMIPAVGEGDIGPTVGEKRRKRPRSPAHLSSGNGEEMVSGLNLPFDDDPPPVSLFDSEVGSTLPTTSTATVEVLLDDMKSTLLSTEVLAKYSAAVDKLKVEMKRTTVDDHMWCLKSWDKDGKGIVKLYCGECSKLYGNSVGDHSKTTISNLFGNFSKKHLVSTSHIRNWCTRTKTEFSSLPQSESKEKGVVMIRADHEKLADEGIHIVDLINDSVDQDHKPFVIIGDRSSPHMRCFWLKVKCKFCGDFFQLCPPRRNLEANLTNHIMGPKHASAVEAAQNTRGRSAVLRTGKKGRPATSSVCLENQGSLHSWFTSQGSNSQSGQIHRPLSLLCWGYWRSVCSYAGKMYLVQRLLLDLHPGGSWIAEPETKGRVDLGAGETKIIEGCFRHKGCRRVSMSGAPFDDLTCTRCARIPQEVDFRHRVMREELSLEKRGTRSSAGGRRLGFLQSHELFQYSRHRAYEIRLAKQKLCRMRALVCQLKITRPTLREAAAECENRRDVLKLCNNIILAHKTKAFGGKAALWDFIVDVGNNLNKKSAKGNRFSSNTAAFAQTVKLYGGRRLTDLFSLNLAGPSLSTVKLANKKGVQFVGGFRPEIFSAVASIYKNAIEAYGLVGPIPVLMAEDETKIKTRVSWESRSDTMTGFCGRVDDHVCEPGYSVVVGDDEAGYNKILDSFQNCRMGTFARVIMVNPLHTKLPRLVIAICCTCNSFNSSWVREQWVHMEKLWAAECKQVVGPIIGHASDGDSRRRQLMLQDYLCDDVTKKRRSIPWVGWKLSVLLNADGESMGLHDQDFIHNGKKLINPLDSPAKTLQLGMDVACIQHIEGIYNKFKLEEHGLKQEDIVRKDRQNWGSAQRICQQRVQ